jgi:hypothetical protein
VGFGALSRCFGWGLFLCVGQAGMALR